MKYNIPRGTYDIFRSELNSYNVLVNTLIDLAYRFNYDPINIPSFEESSLFHRAVGESSDIVTKETFDLVNKGTSYTLRPEFTAGIMRAIVSNKFYGEPDMPLKFVYHGPVFRYERPQKGRYREFRQLGVENIGVTSAVEDANVIILGYKMYIEAFKKFNLTDKIDNFYVKINCLGDESTREQYRNVLKDYFSKYIGYMCDDCKVRFEKNTLRILDCKVDSDRKIIAGAPKISDYLSHELKEYYDTVKYILANNNIKYVEDDNLVRGLDYYSKVVFEFYNTKYENLGALGAGGHYDKLLNEVGGPLLEGVGFSIGMERLYELLKETQFELPLDYYIASLVSKKEEYVYCLALQNELIDNKYSVDINLKTKGLSAQLKTALRKKAKQLIIIGDEEVSNNTVTIKDIEDKTQVTMPRKQFFDKLERR